MFEKDRAAMDRDIRGATVKVGCVRVDASNVDYPYLNLPVVKLFSKEFKTK